MTEDAFPDSTDFEYSMERTFNDQARLFTERRCACVSSSLFILMVMRIAENRAEGTSGDDEGDEATGKFFSHYLVLLID